MVSAMPNKDGGTFFVTGQWRSTVFIKLDFKAFYLFS